MMQKMAANSSEMVKNSSPVDVVSKVILQAVTSKDPNLRYLAGKDVEKWAASKKAMSDTEFHNMIKNLGQWGQTPPHCYSWRKRHPNHEWRFALAMPPLTKINLNHTSFDKIRKVETPESNGQWWPLSYVKTMRNKHQYAYLRHENPFITRWLRHLSLNQFPPRMTQKDILN